MLFEKFDRFFTEWDTEEDARQIAVDMLNNNDFPSEPDADEIANYYGWETHRVETATHLLEKRGAVKIYDGVGTGYWLLH